MWIVKIRNLNIYFKTAIIASILGLLAVVITSFLFFIGYSEIPFGFLIGLSIGVIFEILIAFVDEKSKIKNKKGTLLTILLTSSRVLVVGLTLFIFGYLYYQENIKLFNLFAIAGGYLFVTLVLIVLSFINKGKENE